MYKITILVVIIAINLIYYTGELYIESKILLTWHKFHVSKAKLFLLRPIPTPKIVNNSSNATTMCKTV